MYNLIIGLLRPFLIRRSVNLVSAVRLEGSNFNQWLSVIEIQTNFFLYLTGAKPGMSAFNSISTLRQVVIPWFEHLEYLKKTIRRHVASGEAQGVLSPYQDFQDFWFVFKCLFIFFLGQDCLMSLPPFTFSCRRTAGLRD